MSDKLVRKTTKFNHWEITRDGLTDYKVWPSWLKDIFFGSVETESTIFREGQLYHINGAFGVQAFRSGYFMTFNLPDKDRRGRKVASHLVVYHPDMFKQDFELVT